MQRITGKLIAILKYKMSYDTSYGIIQHPISLFFHVIRISSGSTFSEITLQWISCRMLLVEVHTSCGPPGKKAVQFYTNASALQNASEIYLADKIFLCFKVAEGK